MTRKMEQRNNDILALYKDGFTLQEIGDKYGITRERVRQIVDKLGGCNGFAVRKERAVLLSKEINQMTYTEFEGKVKEMRVSRGVGMELRKGRRHPVIESGKGYIFQSHKDEQMISNLLKRKGIDNELMPNHHPFDILAKGRIKIDVKCAYKVSKTSKVQVSPNYRIGVKKKDRRDYCDFFIAYIHDTKDFFVIPNSEVGYVESIYIGYPTVYEGWSKWHAFKNRFDLLKGNNE